MDEKDTVPQQQQGNESNTEESITLANEPEAKDFYQVVRQRLLRVNGWQQLAGKATANFQLTDEKGNAVDREVQQGDHFKIDIPGPGPVTGDGFDWVRVEAVEENKNTGNESITIRVRPATNPQNNREDIAHFFSEEATSNFIVSRNGNKVSAAVLGRNEKPNTDAATVVDKARNTAVAGGAISGFSKLQWKSLVHGLLKKL